MGAFSEYLRLINNCDQGDPLLSTTTLGKHLQQIQLSSVDKVHLVDLTQALNLEQLIPTESGLPRDYRGLAELMGFSSIEIETRFKRAYNPTMTLITAYTTKNLAEKGDKLISLNNLLKMIELIERFDVIDDFIPTLVKLASYQEANTYQQPQGNLEIAFNGNVQALENYSPSQLDGPRISDNSVTLDGFNRLTIDDTNLAASRYDAFICYAPEDIHYAQELMCVLQDQDARVATADDLLPGHFEYDALIRLIDSRCRKVIIILTPNFIRSKECEFQTKFANEIGIKDRDPKIIPILYERIEDSALPRSIQVMTKINMTNPASRQWQVMRLVRSLELNMQHNSTAWRQQAVNSSFMRAHTITTGSNIHLPVTNETLRPLPAPNRSSSPRSGSSIEPIVDLQHSESSRASISSFGQTDSTSRTSPQSSGRQTPTHMSNNSPMNWFKSFKKKVLGNSNSTESISPTNSSRIMLISSTSSENFHDDKAQGR